MKALTLLQPWASLVVMGVKSVETRSWNTKYRGELLIHASLGKAGSIFASEPPFNIYIPDFRKLSFGFILGKVTLTDVQRMGNVEMSDELMNRLTMEEKAFGDYSEGRFAWILEDAVQFAVAIPARGMFNLWEYRDYPTVIP